MKRQKDENESLRKELKKHACGQKTSIDAHKAKNRYKDSFDYIESNIDENEFSENERKNVPSESRCFSVHKPLYRNLASARQRKPKRSLPMILEKKSEEVLESESSTEVELIQSTAFSVKHTPHNLPAHIRNDSFSKIYSAVHKELTRAKKEEQKELKAELKVISAGKPIKQAIERVDDLRRSVITSRSLAVESEEAKKEELKSELSEEFIVVKKEEPRLFEEFFIVGAEYKTLEAASAGMETKATYVTPETLFQYPDLPENKNWFGYSFNP